jgi:hypothetical protein
LKPTIYKNPGQFIKILQTSLFSKSSLSLHATEQLVQETIKLFFSPSKQETFDDYHCSSSENGNLNFLECHFDAPSDYHMQETFMHYLP